MLYISKYKIKIYINPEKQGIGDTLRTCFATHLAVIR